MPEQISVPTRHTIGMDVATQTKTIASCDVAAEDGIVTWYRCVVECQATRHPSGKRFIFNPEKTETRPGKRDKYVQTPRRALGSSKTHQTPRWEGPRSLWPPAGFMPPPLHTQAPALRRVPQAPIPPTPPPTPPTTVPGPIPASSSRPRILSERDLLPEDYVPRPIYPPEATPPVYRPTPI